MANLIEGQEDAEALDRAHIIPSLSATSRLAPTRSGGSTRRAASRTASLVADSSDLYNQIISNATYQGRSSRVPADRVTTRARTR